MKIIANFIKNIFEVKKAILTKYQFIKPDKSEMKATYKDAGNNILKFIIEFN